MKTKEKAEAAEKARVEALKPDKEKLIQYAKNLTQIIGPDVKDKAAQRIVVLVEKQLSNIAQEIIKKSKEL